jgi:hypothetical protein
VWKENVCKDNEGCGRKMCVRIMRGVEGKLSEQRLALHIPELSEEYLALSIPEIIRTDFYEIQITAVQNLISVHVLPKQILTHMKFKFT